MIELVVAGHDALAAEAESGQLMQSASETKHTVNGLQVHSCAACWEDSIENAIDQILLLAEGSEASCKLAVGPLQAATNDAERDGDTGSASHKRLRRVGGRILSRDGQAIRDKLSVGEAVNCAVTYVNCSAISIHVRLCSCLTLWKQELWCDQKNNIFRCSDSRKGGNCGSASKLLALIEGMSSVHTLSQSLLTEPS